MKHLSEEIKKELKEELGQKEAAILLSLKEKISPNPEFVKVLKNKLTGGNKKLTPSPWQIFFVRGKVFAGLVLLLVTAPLVFILVKNNSSLELETGAPAGERSFLQSPANIKDANAPGRGALPEASQSVPPVQLKTMVAPNAPSFEKTRQEAGKEFDLSLDQITVIKYEEKIWPNTCLGLIKKNSNCLAIETSGFLITLQAGTTTVTYNTDKEENIILRQ